MLKLLRNLRGRLLGLAAAGVVCAGTASAQTPEGVSRKYPEHKTGFRCAFDSAQQAAFARQPGAAAAYRAFLQGVATMSATAQARLLAAPDVTVPVVVHIIHTGGSNNISDAQVADAIRVINEDYSKTNRDTTDILPAFRPIAANIGFQMRLAKKDPNGNCTTGITRTYSADGNIGDDRVKDLIKWDQDKYLNIWVCDNANGAGGYAYLPCTGGAVDGIVIRNAQFGSVGTSCGANLCIRSLTHEIGHYFGLPHTWGGSNTPGLPSNCGIDDGIADTPNTIGAQSSCSSSYGTGTVLSSFNPCGPLANVQNYMDYSSCTNMFTLGQRAVMRASLQLSCRSVLTSTANLLATGTNDGYVAPSCAPVVTFEPSARTVCEGSTVSFTDYSYNAAVASPSATYAWQFPGGVPSTSSLRNPVVTYSTGGVYNVTLTIMVGGQTGTSTRNSLVQVVGGNSGLVGPVAESFENPDFPENFPAPSLRNWTNSSNTTSTGARWFRRTNVVGGLLASDGTACVLVPSTVLALGTQTTLTSPNINLSGLTVADQPALSFDRAYALRTTQPNENLSIQFSSDCGVTWNTQRTLFPNALNTRDTVRIDGFTPTVASDWKRLRIDIPASYLRSTFQVRFTLVSNRGNYFYLDKVAVGAAPILATRTGGAAPQARIYPNPLTAETVVEFTLPAAGPVELGLTDLLGRAVSAPIRATGRAGLQTLPLLPGGISRPTPGIYLMQLRTAAGQTTSKVIIP
ncbi:M43 family zinc metalloprotease [Hymenobacter negativus]|uniref:T9SS type A sorting domain-containing protein n=1 Tax=Hymenobacter negativus TaxID=2795026 RepID=A0ABS3QMV3_9BACT|nr:M43 family zinc metalloprotease [Hymenobacter negativus]MBO2012605.1 T9SS type A sorting domain-containing protein [Hymenobacter negativus]